MKKSGLKKKFASAKAPCDSPATSVGKFFSVPKNLKIVFEGRKRRNFFSSDSLTYNELTIERQAIWCNSQLLWVTKIASRQNDQKLIHNLMAQDQAQGSNQPEKLNLRHP